MWARAGQLLLIAAAALTGCSMMQSEYLPYGSPRVGSRDVATFDEAIGLAANLSYEAAAEKFQQVLPRFEAARDRRRAAESMFWLAFCREKLGSTAEAGDLYRRLVKKYGRLPAAEQARQRLEALPPAG